jgi:hypothetical protein
MFDPGGSETLREVHEAPPAEKMMSRRRDLRRVKFMSSLPFVFITSANRGSLLSFCC